MSTQVTLTLPDDLYEYANHWAGLTKQDLTQTLTDALRIVLPPVHKQLQLEKAVADLPDDEVLALSKLKMETMAGRRLGDLVDKQREEELDASEQQELQALMQVYNQLWIRQSEALAESVRRGLRPPLAP